MTTPSSTQFSSYVIPNSMLVKDLKLQKHPEGGYFVETDRQTDEVPSPFVDGALRPLATTIHYLLTHEEPNGVFHMNKSATMHILHQGRAEYTLITPGTPPKIEKKVMGYNINAGEVLQLLVPTGIWKMSRLLEKDLAAASTGFEMDHCGCLITEVVFPGFVWGDHKYLTGQAFEQLWDGFDDPSVKGLVQYVKKD